MKITLFIKDLWAAYQQVREEDRQLKALLAKLDCDCKRAQFLYEHKKAELTVSLILDKTYNRNYNRDAADELVDEVISRAARKVALGLVSDPVKYFQAVGREVLLEELPPALSPPMAHLVAPPGWKLRSFAEFFFSKKTFTAVLEPALSDMQHEHLGALAASRPWQARMVLVRGYWSFWSAVLAQLPISFARRVYEVWKATKS